MTRAWSVVIAASALAATACSAQAQQVGADARAQQIIRELHLQVLPKESGYLGLVGVTPLKVRIGGHEFSVQSQNYYMLTRERPINYLHRLESADTHILIEGGPVDYYIFHPDGRAERLVLGMNLVQGEGPMIAVPPGCWKALVLRSGSSYALMANTLSPEFTGDRVRIGEGAQWVKRFAGKAGWATPERLREFIGPTGSPEYIKTVPATPAPAAVQPSRLLSLPS